MDLKKSTMDDSSEIYNKERFDGTTKDDYKNMSKKQKLTFFRDYYLKYVIIAIVAVLIGVYIIHGMTKAKPEDTFKCALINGIYLNPDYTSELTDSFWDYMIDDVDYTGSRNRDKIFFETYADDFNSETKLSGEYDKSKIDVMIMNSTSAETYAKNGQLYDLQSIFTEDTIKGFGGNVLYTTNSLTNENVAYGIIISKDILPLYASDGSEYEAPVLCIIGNTTRLNTAIEFIKFLYSSK